jgi:RNA polymerase sigma-70 factor (ECF subfamily)
VLTEEELTACIESRRGPLTRMVASMLDDPTEAEDVVQESALRALRARQDFRSEADVCSWFQRICINSSHETGRRRASAAMKVEAARREALWRDPAYSVDAEAVVMAMEDRNALKTALATLNPDQRTAVVLHDLQGLKAREIAADIGMPLATVKSHLRRGRQALVTVLAEARR